MCGAHGGFDEMTDLSRRDRAALAERFTLARPDVSDERLSVDGSRKWLLRLADGGEIETVYIPEADRGTLCVSSQIGCTLTCRFCHTGTQRLVRNLDAGEIVGQILHARDVFGEWSGRAAPLVDRGRHVSNIVLMGMGEPLYNFDNVKAAMAVATDGDGLAISKRRITLSTAGVVPMMDRCGDEIGVNLAVSLHAVTDELARRTRAAQPQIPAEGTHRRLPALPDRKQCPAHHLRICDAGGRQ